MKELTSEERILRTLRREDTDRVPTFEWLIDKKVMNAIKPGISYEEFCYEYGQDAICIDCDYKSERIKDDKIRDEWGMIKMESGQAHTFPLDGPIRTMRDLDNYNPPDPFNPDRYRIPLGVMILVVLLGLIVLLAWNVFI